MEAKVAMATSLPVSNSKGASSKKDDDSTPRNIGSILGSEVICITVGAEEEQLFVHRAVFENSDSHSLKQVVSGKFKEGKGENGLDWTTEDPETVRRLLAYLYCGDYHVPKPEVKNVTADAQGFADAGASTLVGQDSGKKPKGEQEEQCEQIAAATIIRPLTPIQYHLEHIRLPTWRYNTEAGDLEHTSRLGKEFAFAEAMLAHARLYVLAQYHLLCPLETLTLQRLTQVMVLAESHSYNLEDDVLPIVTFTYNCGEFERPSELRELVSQFVALNFHRFEGDGVLDILEVGGGFVRDVCSKIGRQLLANELKAGGGRGRVAQKTHGKATVKPTRLHNVGNFRHANPINARPSLIPADVAHLYSFLGDGTGTGTVW
ncbi:hypothetical protein TWF730_009271 [Orbilia blumenaviensis]|uniref:BTB domain-containing protein n=1 Tax=Orbilia blumenaviensis TaxID=1796055 RepID=A0AAV9V0W9_9PEZI